MSLQASFTLRSRNPDVLNCIANLSNDEVFTPPELANRMLDTLAEAWAADNRGANIWADATVKFLDPCTKSGVFLREITSRLVKGLENKIPDLQKRVDHILTKQVFGIATTQLTSLLARRSIYCSKNARGKHSIAKQFSTDDGNVWFQRSEHTWGNTKCEYCGAPRDILDRGKDVENYAYAFIHTDDVGAPIRGLFGDDMQFDVVIGNPPYQMKGGGGGTNDSSIYQLFVEQAMKLKPRFLSMVVPSRWMAGGRGMDEFRAEMLKNSKLRELVDFPLSKDVFPNVAVEGGICYFLWEESHKGKTNVTTIRGEEATGPVARDLGEFDVFVRDSRAVEILHKVQSKSEPSVVKILTGDTPFGIATNFDAFHSTRERGDIVLHLVRRGKRLVGYVPRSVIRKNAHLIDSWKVLTPKAHGGTSVPSVVLGKPLVAGPGSVCTQTFLAFWVATEQEAASLESYYRTKFFRFLVSLRKITQDALKGNYSWVPQQSWDRNWTDAELYKKYKLTASQIEFIESVIKPMEIDSAEDDE